MGQITYPDKSTGDLLTAAETNNIKDAGKDTDGRLKTLEGQFSAFIITTVTQDYVSTIFDT